MASTPTSKSQVQAYRFVLRRMQSALVRRDAVMLHDPMRTHSRATIVGIVLGAFGMVVFIVWGLLAPAPAVPGAPAIVIGEQSGTIYVVSGNPKTLTPTFNLASARLLLLAQQQQQQNANGGGAAQPASGGTASAVVPATVVSDEQLKNVPRGPLTGIPDGPGLIPADSQRISADWAVCDEVKLDPSLPQPDSANVTDTTVFGGVPQSRLGTELKPDEALYATADNGKNYLIYRLPSSPNRPNANTVRAEVDPGHNNSVGTALLLPTHGRKISQGLLNAIPEVNPLAAPTVDGDGTAAPADFDGLNVGDVFSTEPSGSAPDYWLITKTGIQKISSAVADITRVAKNGSGGRLRVLGLDKIRGVHQLQPNDPGYVAVDDFPQQKVTVLDATKGSPVACLGWSLVNPGSANADGHTSVFVGNQQPKGADGNPLVTQAMNTPGPNNIPLKGFYMQPGYAAVVQSTTGPAGFGKGNIQLISDRGLRYSVPDKKTADGIGLTNPLPAPDSIIGLLPTGASLNTQDVRRQFDSIPIPANAGTYPPPPPPSAGN